MNKLLAGVCAVGCLAGVAQAGWEYTSVTKAEGTRGSEAMSQTVKGLVDGDNGRFEFVASGNPILGVGTYLLTRDAGAKVYLVNPKEKSYALWDIKALMGAVGALAKPAISNMKVDKVSEEKGEKILGYATTRYKLHSAYTMTMNIFGMVNASSIDREQEFWAAPALKDAAFSFRGMLQGMKSGDEGLDKLFTEQMSQVKGFPLKMTSTQTTKDSRGQTQTMKIAMEVTELKEVKAGSSAFELPAGYTEQPLLPLGVGAPAGQGQAGKQGGAPDMGAIMKMMQERMKNSGGSSGR